MALALSTNEVQVLWQIKMGIQSYCKNRLEVALLIALEYVTADNSLEKLDITDKGRRILSLYRHRETCA